MTAHFKNRNAVSQAVRDSAEGETCTLRLGCCIIAIRTAYRSGTSLADIAKAHDIAYGTVFPIVNGKSFRHIAPELITKQGSRCPRKLSADDVAAIRSALSSGQQSQAVIAKKYGVGSGLVSRIKTGHRHKLQTSTQDQLL